MAGRLRLFLALLFGVTLVLAGAARAQDDGSGGSFITPFPEGDSYRMLVIGDSLAAAMVDGLAEAFSGAEGVQIPRKPRALNGLTRDGFDEDAKGLEDPQWREPLHIAIVSTGLYDRQPLRNAAGRRIPPGMPEWRELYTQRVDRVMKALKRKKAAVYWVGLPIVRRPDWNRDIEVMNEIFRERSFVNGMKYVDVYTSFADETGDFNAYGPDITGKIRLLREGDGVGLTEAGGRKLAHFVERVVMRDLQQAKSERTIPLLGTEAEQKKIVPGKSAEPQTGDAAAKAKGPVTKALAGGVAPAASTEGEQKADNSKIQLRFVSPQGREEQISVELPRPTIAANVMAVITRRESPDRPSQVGDTLTNEIAGGLLVMTSVTPSAESGGRRRVPPTQAPYFRVLVKGERLEPKPGRVDDFSWPKPEPKVEPAAAAQPPAAAPAAARRPQRPGGTAGGGTTGAGG